MENKTTEEKHIRRTKNCGKQDKRVTNNVWKTRQQRKSKSMENYTRETRYGKQDFREANNISNTKLKKKTQYMENKPTEQEVTNGKQDKKDE